MQLEEDEKGGAESEEEKAQRMAASKQRKLSMMRHAVSRFFLFVAHCLMIGVFSFQV